MAKHIWFMDGHCETDVVHYGKKGMRWGVVNEREESPAASNPHGGGGVHNPPRLRTTIRDKLRDQMAEQYEEWERSVKGHIRYGAQQAFDEFQRIKPENLREAYGRLANAANEAKTYAENLQVALAAELRARGYDVLPRLGSITEKEADKILKQLDTKDISSEIRRNATNSGTSTTIDNAVRKSILDSTRGKDQSGFLVIGPDNNKTIINYQCKNGKVTFVDSKTGSENEAIKQLRRTSKIKMCRTDNKLVDPKIMSKALTGHKKGQS